MNSYWWAVVDSPRDFGDIKNEGRADLFDSARTMSDFRGNDIAASTPQAWGGAFGLVSRRLLPGHSDEPALFDR